MYHQYGPAEPEPVGKRIGRFLVLCVVVAAITLAVIAVTQFSSETLALIIGLSIGFGVMIGLAVIALAVFAAISRRRRESPPPMQQYAMPPIVLQVPTPTLPPGYGYPQGYGMPSEYDARQPQLADSRREWSIVGGTD